MHKISENKPKMRHAVKIFTLLLLVFVFGVGASLREATDKKFVVVLDAGHGGTDPGNLGTGRYSKTEKDISLAVTLQVGKLIEANYPNVKVVYTRTGDTFPTLKRRVEIANTNNADLFISIHCNANDNTAASGSESFVMGLHKSEESLRTAMRENASIFLESNAGRDYEGFDPNNPDTYIALSLRENIFQDKSIQLAKNVQDQFRVKVGRKDRGVKQAGYYVISFTNMPSILVELGFLTNSTEEDYLQSAEGKEYMSAAIYRAFQDYQAKLFNVQPVNGQEVVVKQNEIKPTVDYASLIWREDEKDQVMFKVQILSSAQAINKNSQQFHGLPKFEEYLSNGTHKYMAGSSRSLEEAKKNQKLLREAGFTGAFVVAFVNGERISMEEALKKTQE